MPLRFDPDGPGNNLRLSVIPEWPRNENSRKRREATNVRRLKGDLWLTGMPGRFDDNRLKTGSDELIEQRCYLLLCISLFIADCIAKVESYTDLNFW
jgi:hypothetical protein